MVNKEDSVDRTREKIARIYWLAHINYCRLSDPSIPIFDEMDFYEQKLINHKMFYDFADEILAIIKEAGYIKKPKVRVLNDEEIRWKLEQIQPEGFDWVNITQTEMIKYRAIAQTQRDKDAKSLEER